MCVTNISSVYVLLHGYSPGLLLGLFSVLFKTILGYFSSRAMQIIVTIRTQLVFRRNLTNDGKLHIFSAALIIE